MSQRWTLQYAPAAVRFLERVRDAKLSRRLQKTLESLRDDPRPQGSIKLSGEDDLHRVRVGDYRIIYQVQDAVLLVLVVDIGHRRDIYR
jgi:mRNA interferase RelE/StbE